MRPDQLSNTLQSTGGALRERGLLCMARKACRTPDTNWYGEVYVEIDYTVAKRRELLFANWWEAEIFARARKYIAVHVCGFVPPDTMASMVKPGPSMWDQLALMHGDADVEAGHDWHQRYLAKLDKEARERGEFEYEMLIERLMEEEGPPDESD